MNPTGSYEMSASDRLRRVALACAALLAFLWGVGPVPMHAQGQVLTFDWASRPKDIGQSVSAPNLSLSAPATVTFSIINVNDVFYTYTMSCTATPASQPDLTAFASIVTGQGEAAESQCDQKATALHNKIVETMSAPDACGTDCTSTPVSDTTKALTEYVQEIKDLLADQTCTPSATIVKQLKSDLADLTDDLNKPHTITFQNVVDPTMGYICTVTEARKGQPTKDGTLKIAINATTDIVTFSVGPLFSGVQNRSYSAVSVPNSDASGTNTVLGVQGKSLSSSILALANFRFPWPKLSRSSFGLDVSAGPVLRLNSASGSSPVGFFGGLSLRLYHYLFITPGFHVGQFADFPQGFTHAGQTVPPNFGTLQPVTRTTVKFGLAISFAAKDFTSLGKSSTTAVSPPAATGQPTPSPQPSTTPPVPQSGGSNATNVPVSFPASVSFGTLGRSQLTKTLDFKNTSGQTVTLSFDLQDSTGQVGLSSTDTARCATLQPSADCTLTLTLNPGTGTPGAVLNVVINDSTPEHILVTWTK